MLRPPLENKPASIPAPPFDVRIYQLEQCRCATSHDGCEPLAHALGLERYVVPSLQETRLVPTHNEGASCAAPRRIVPAALVRVPVRRASVTAAADLLQVSARFLSPNASSEPFCAFTSAPMFESFVPPSFHAEPSSRCLDAALGG